MICSDDDGITIPNMPAAKMIEQVGFNNEQLSDYFGEAWGIIMVLHQVKDADVDFATQILPDTAAANAHLDRSLFINDAEYDK